MVQQIAVRFTAEDEATEVARKLLDIMRGLEREQKAAAQATAALAAPTKAAAEGFEKIRAAIVGVRNTGGVDAISKRVALLAQGLKSASTQSASLQKLTAAEAQLQKALKNTNLSLEQRITLERTLQQVQSAIRGSPVDIPQGVIARAQQLHGALVAIAAAVGAARLLGFAKDAVDAADSLNNLSQRTGASVETLSVLTKEAEKAGASTESLTTEFRNLAKSVEQLRSGSPDAAASFAAIGLTAQDIAGLSLDDIFVKIADAQSKFADGSGKAAVATRLFGRAGDEIIPLLNQLANGGFGRATDEARALGGVLSTEGARAADQFNDSLVNLRTAVGGFSNQLLTALAPLTKLVDGVSAFLSRIPNGLKAFLAAAGVAAAAATVLAGAIGGIVLAFGLLATAVGGGVVAGVIAAIAGIATAAGLLAAKFRSAREEKDKLLTTPDHVVSFELIDNRTGKVTTGAKPDISIADPAALKAARQAELSAAKQHEKDLLAIEQAGLRQQQQAEDDAFAANLVGFGAHFNKRIELARAGVQAEVAAINSELATLRAQPLPENTRAARVQRESEINSLVAQRTRVEIEGETTVNSLLAQQTVARKAAITELATITATLFRQQGQELRAQQIEIEQSANRFAETLTRQGFGTEIVTQLRTTFSTLQTDIAAFRTQQTAAERELSGLARDRAQIEQAVATNKLSQREGDAALIAAERARIPALRQAAELMRQFAERVGDPALLEAAKQIETTINGMGQATSRAAQLAKDFKDNLLGAAQGEFANFLGSTINNVKSLGDAFRQLGAAIAGAFQRVAADVLSAQLFEKLAGLFGGGVNTGAAALAKAGVEVQKGGAAVLFAAGALAAAATQLLTVSSISAGLSAARGVLAFAEGGLVRGPGTGTSDSIPARLSNREFVQPAATVRHYGVRLMELLRLRKVPREVLEEVVGSKGPIRSDHPPLRYEIATPQTGAVIDDRHPVVGGPVVTDAVKVRVMAEQLTAQLTQAKRNTLTPLVQPQPQASSHFRSVVDRVRELFGRVEKSEGSDQSVKVLVSVPPVSSVFVGTVAGTLDTIPRHALQHVRERAETVGGVYGHPDSPNAMSAISRIVQTSVRDVTQQRSVSRAVSDSISHVVRSVIETVHQFRSLGRQERGEGGGELLGANDVSRFGLHLAGITREHRHSELRTVDHHQQVLHALARDLARVVVGERGVREGNGNDRIAAALAPIYRAVGPIREIDIKQPFISAGAVRVGSVRPERGPLLGSQGRRDAIGVAHVDSVETRQYSIARLTESIREWFRTIVRSVGSPQLMPTFRVAALMAPLAFAGGGYVRGPGTSTSDSIPARLSTGEYVQPARATAFYGVRVMEALRRMEIPRDVFASLALAPLALHTPPVRSLESAGIPNIQRFADGGLVTATDDPVTATLSRDDRLAIEVMHSDEALVRVLESTRGVRVLTRLMQRHAGQFKAALG